MLFLCDFLFIKVHTHVTIEAVFVTEDCSTNLALFTIFYILSGWGWGVVWSNEIFVANVFQDAGIGSNCLTKATHWMTP